MRKTVIALILVLPMLFVLVVFAAGNTVSISVPVSVNGIHILVDGDRLGDNDIFEVDHTEALSHTVTAEVEPANASDKKYTITSDNPDVLEVADDGSVITHGEGSANVTATSNDRSFTDKIPVVVHAGHVYDVNFVLLDPDGEAVALTYNEHTKSYNLPGNSTFLSTGKYSYKLTLAGGDSREYGLASESAEAIVNQGEQSILFPFSSSDVRLKLTVPDYFDGNAVSVLNRDVSLRFEAPASHNGIVINGKADRADITLAEGTTAATLYVESDGEPTLTGDGIQSRCILHSSNGNSRAVSGKQHVLEVTFTDDFKNGDKIEATLTVNGNTAPVNVTFAEFDFNVRSDTPESLTDQGDKYVATVLKGVSNTFYAVSTAETNGITYQWECATSGLLTVQPSNTQTCAFKAPNDGNFTITVTAKRDGNAVGVTKTIEVKVVTKVNSVTIANNPKPDLAERYTMGGSRYNASGGTEDSTYQLSLIVSKQNEPRPLLNDFTDIVFESSDDGVATVRVENGKACVVPNGNGAVTITAKWTYADIFGGQAAKFALNVVKDAVEVDNYPDLQKAMEQKRKTVLTKSIMLGTDKDYDVSVTMPTDPNAANYSVALQAYQNNLKHVWDLAKRQSLVENQKYLSTYNTEFYKADKNFADVTPYVKYALEFTNDVYGNGFDLNAEYISNAQDSFGAPQIFKGPLVFVEWKVAASVAGQDNCSFLVRTDGITLYGVNLMGCGDSSLYETDEKGNSVYQLNNLNKIGTTLEINADCNVVNCRLSNGRNVVRVYGGNQNGTDYFVNAVPAADVDSKDRIVVTLDGCIITQGREFLVKEGSNRALKANTLLGKDPQLNAAYTEIKDNFNGKSYNSNKYNIGDTGVDSFFYKRYVMTDLTLRNSVLETTGLFCVGVESNFAGAMLYDGAEKELTGDNAKFAAATPTWRQSGGTSFPCVLRLEGDVRTYGWQDVNLVDSSTLIEPTGTGDVSELLKFNISAMLQAVDGNEQYGNLLYKDNGTTYVHGGIAFYGGGRNYSQIVLDGLNSQLKEGLKQYSINISQFASAEGIVSTQAQLLPYAAGTHSFNFWMYDADGANNYAWQQNKSYNGVVKVPLFAN